MTCMWEIMQYKLSWSLSKNANEGRSWGKFSLCLNGRHLGLPVQESLELSGPFCVVEGPVAAATTYADVWTCASFSPASTQQLRTKTRGRKPSFRTLEATNSVGGDWLRDCCWRIMYPVGQRKFSFVFGPHPPSKTVSSNHSVEGY